MALLTTVQKTSELDDFRLDAIVQLWGRVFGDSEEFIRRFYALNSDPSDGLGITDGCAVYAIWDGDTLAAMLNRIPVCSVMGDELIVGGYVYAACTAPEYRGEGLFRELMAFVELGVDFITLIPASEELYETYSRLGYETELFSFYPFEVEALPGEILPFDHDWDKLYSLYLEHIPQGGIIRSQGFFRFALDDFDIAYYAGGYIAYKLHDDENDKKLTKIYEIYCPSSNKSDIIGTNDKMAIKTGLIKAIEPTFTATNAVLTLFGQY